MYGPLPTRSSATRSLFNEAVYGPEVIRLAARQALKVLVAIGGDGALRDLRRFDVQANINGPGQVNIGRSAGGPE